MSQHQRSRPVSRAGSEQQGAGSRPVSCAGSGQQRAGSHPPSRAGSEPVRTTLLCVAYGGPLPHWGFFHLDNEEDQSGVLIHVGVITGSSGLSSKYDNSLRFDHIASMSTTAIQHTYPIPGAVLSRDDAITELSEIYRTKIKDYQALNNNCQHFCIIGMKELQKGPCPAINNKTISDITKKTNPTTRVTVWLKNVGGRLKRAK